MQHTYQSSVDIGCTQTFGATCSCGKIHLAKLENGKVLMDNNTEWVKSPKPPKREIKLGRWGMVRI